MKPLAMTGEGSEAKVAAIVGGTLPIWSGTVLDVGCRSREIERALATDGSAPYVGVDLAATGDVVADLGDHLPFPNDSVDIVVALDVLEHTDGIHAAFGELCRVARRNVVLSLPNEFDVKQRFLTLRGRHTGKWGLPVDAPLDRHRWRFTLGEAQEFCRYSAATNGWCVDAEYALIGPARNSAIGLALIARWPGLFVPTYVAVLSFDRGRPRAQHVTDRPK
jgi:SAM-dependent methyltransferase